jgi:hypothetical protein
MDPTIARLNIAHYKRLLAEETDHKRRDILLRLIAEEEAKIGANGRGNGNHADSDDEKH